MRGRDLVIRPSYLHLPARHDPKGAGALCPARIYRTAAAFGRARPVCDNRGGQRQPVRAHLGLPGRGGPGEAAAAMQADPDRQAYLKLSAEAGYLEKQENKLLLTAPFM